MSDFEVWHLSFDQRSILAWSRSWAADLLRGTHTSWTSLCIERAVLWYLARLYINDYRLLNWSTACLGKGT